MYVKKSTSFCRVLKNARKRKLVPLSFFPPHGESINIIEKSRTARSDMNTNSCPKTFNRTVTGYIFYHTSKILQIKKKTKKIDLFSGIPKTFKDVKFTADGGALTKLN